MEEVCLKSLKFIENHLAEALTLEAIATNAGYSTYYFSRVFKSHMGMPVMEYVKERRLIKASEAIGNGSRILEAALSVGYESHNGFAKAFKNKFGFSPQLLRAYHWQQNDLEPHKCMGHIFMNSTAIHTPVATLYEHLIQTMAANQKAYDLNNIQQAFAFALKAHETYQWRTGDDYVVHPLNVAILLAELEADEDVIVAGLLHDVAGKSSNCSLQALEKEFPKPIVSLIKKGMTFVENKENDDEQVLLIKICDRLHIMRTIEYSDQNRRQQKAAQTICRYSSVSDKLSHEKLIAELTDLSVRYI